MFEKGEYQTIFCGREYAIPAGLTLADLVYDLRKVGWELVSATWTVAGPHVDCTGKHDDGKGALRYTVKTRDPYGKVHSFNRDLMHIPRNSDELRDETVLPAAGVKDCQERLTHKIAIDAAYSLSIVRGETC